MFALTGAAIAGPSETPEPETPGPESSEIVKKVPVPSESNRPIPAPVVKPIPAHKLLSWRHEPIALPFEWDSERGWIDRRK